MNWTKHRGKFVWTSGPYKVQRVTGRNGLFAHGFEALHDGQAIVKTCFGFASEGRRACEIHAEQLPVRQGASDREAVLR